MTGPGESLKKLRTGFLSHPGPNWLAVRPCPKQPGAKNSHGGGATGVIGGRPIQKTLRKLHLIWFKSRRGLPD
jgi:hypothetical protein